ncbi:MAG: hypothetical protein ACTHLH_02720 [Solirubrobacterales bacterium]
MQDQPSGAGDKRVLTTGEREAREQCRVLREVLSIYPESLTLDELVRELTISGPDFSEEEARNAVRDLIGSGLLHRLGDLVLPTRPAVVYYALSQDGEI